MSSVGQVKFLPLGARPELVDATAQLINSFWKRSFEYRREQLLKSVAAVDAADHWSEAKAAAHFILVVERANDAAERFRGGSTSGSCQEHLSAAVVAHGQLKVAAKQRQVGKTCVAFSIVVDPACRKQGLGSRLLRELEREVAESKFSFLYLYAAPSLARNFYCKVGYRPCDAMTVKRRAFKGLKTAQLEGLEGVFAARSTSALDSRLAAQRTRSTLDSHASPDSPEAAGPADAQGARQSASQMLEDEDPTAGTGTVGSPSPSSGCSRGLSRSVWLRKRLTDRYFRSIKYVCSETIASAKKIAEQYVRSSTAYLCAGPKQGAFTESTCSLAQRLPRWRGSISLVPHLKQIGPSCGLCAISMVACAISGTTNTAEISAPRDAQSSVHDRRIAQLLAEAQRRGVTADGEMFSVSALHSLAQWLLGLETQEEAVSQIDARDAPVAPRATLRSPLKILCCRVRNIEDISATDLLQSPSRPRSTCTKGGIATALQRALIVPYDSRPGNCEPCESMGRCAHYAVVTGVICPAAMPSKDGLNQADGDSATIDWLSARGLPDMLENSNVDIGRVLVLFQHSASRRPVVAPWVDLVRSNLQLRKAISTKSQWVVPDGGPQLMGRCLEICWQHAPVGIRENLDRASKNRDL
eukprot:INCI16079.2.p1 GENE.INCI16079.2~~INCI16079.2.p1  ORF type:complete len:641 (-),score=91.38 INCI16079.2:1063-2985(-)